MSGEPLVWADIDLKAIEKNVRELRRVTNPKAHLMAVVKANGYGHGAVEVARRALQSGADWLGVARIEEGMELRLAGIDAPLLVFGYTLLSEVNTALVHDIRLTVSSFQTAQKYSELAVHSGKKLKVHIKIDTGMGRLGLVAGSSETGEDKNQRDGSAMREMESIARLPGLELEGIFTHFASADSSNKSYTKMQFERFQRALEMLQLGGIDYPLAHAANSAGLIYHPETHLDLVRAGISLYGLPPSTDMELEHVHLEPAMSLKARIVHLKSVPSGSKISYGMTYETTSSTVIATIPVGYADGYSRLLSNKGQMLVHGCRVPVVGRVCMDLTMLDVGQIQGVKVEDEVVVFGKQGGEQITATELAGKLNTINYEIVTSIARRVPRIYLH